MSFNRFYKDKWQGLRVSIDSETKYMYPYKYGEALESVLDHPLYISAAEHFDKASIRVLGDNRFSGIYFHPEILPIVRMILEPFFTLEVGKLLHSLPEDIDDMSDYFKREIEDEESYGAAMHSTHKTDSFVYLASFGDGFFTVHLTTKDPSKNSKTIYVKSSKDPAHVKLRVIEGLADVYRKIGGEIGSFPIQYLDQAKAIIDRAEYELLNPDDEKLREKTLTSEIVWLQGKRDSKKKRKQLSVLNYIKEKPKLLPISSLRPFLLERYGLNRWKDEGVNVVELSHPTNSTVEISAIIAVLINEGEVRELRYKDINKAKAKMSEPVFLHSRKQIHIKGFVVPISIKNCLTYSNILLLEIK